MGDWRSKKVEEAKAVTSTGYKLYQDDFSLIKRVNGLNFRREVEFEEQSRLRTLTKYGLDWFVDDAGVLHVDSNSWYVI